MYNFDSEYNVRNGYVVNHIPQIIPINEYGYLLFGEDPGNIMDEPHFVDQIEKLTR
ncbi:MAG: hypothetical protein K0Q99_1315 [Clostridia bacterium]|jgi:hypothetical protein|nr:hypothetical protein [Clostridia bacterium]